MVYRHSLLLGLDESVFGLTSVVHRPSCKNVGGPCTPAQPLVHVRTSAGFSASQRGPRIEMSSGEINLNAFKQSRVGRERTAASTTIGLELFGFWRETCTKAR
jgi:hypothetical protein